MKRKPDKSGAQPSQKKKMKTTNIKPDGKQQAQNRNSFKARGKHPNIARKNNKQLGKSGNKTQNKDDKREKSIPGKEKKHKGKRVLTDLDKIKRRKLRKLKKKTGKKSGKSHNSRPHLKSTKKHSRPRKT